MIRIASVFLSIGLVLTSCGGGGGSGGSSGSGSGQFSGNCGLKITNGSTCSAGDGPIALVLLESADGTPGAFCTGAFITSRHILTAAHCFTAGFPRIEVQVKSGIHGAGRHHIGTGYNSAGPILQNSDYAILELSSPLAGAQTLPVLGSEAVRVGETINIVGFGLDQNGQSVLQPLAFTEGLRKGTMVVQEIDASTGIFTSSFSSTKQSVCEGDSGGPAIVISSSGTAAIAGVAQAVSESSSSTIRCLQDSSAYFTPITNPTLLAFIRNFAPGANII